MQEPDRTDSERKHWADREAYAQSIGRVAPPARMKPLEVSLCRHVAIGMVPSEAYKAASREAGDTVEYPTAMAGRKALAILKKSHAEKYIWSLRAEISKYVVAGSVELQTWLTAVVFTPIGHVTENSALCQKMTRTVRTDKDGNTTETTTYEMPNKLAAAKQLATMQGLDAPKQIEHNVNGGVMVMPFSTDIDDWAKGVTEQQNQLMKDTLDV